MAVTQFQLRLIKTITGYLWEQVHLLTFWLLQKNDDGGWGNAVASTSCDYIEFWIKDGIIYYNKFFIGINYDGSASNAIYAHHPSDFAGISLANNKQLDDKTFQLAPYYYIEALQGGFDYTGEGGSILITLP